MPFLYLIVAAIVWLRNPFSRKKYQTRLINKVILIYRNNPEIVIHDYYNYNLAFLLEKLKGVKKNAIVFFECPGLRLLKILGISINVYLQIEHTLFRPISENATSGMKGGLTVPGSDERYWVRIAEFSKLRHADIIFDYSRINMLNIQSSSALRDYLQKSFCISPALYQLCTSKEGRDGVITLFGNPNLSRRKLFLENLEQHAISTHNIQGVYLDIEKIYRSVKIVINIRQTDEYQTLEELRVLPALRSGAIVVCESAPYLEKIPYSKFIIWGSLEELPYLIAETVDRYEEVHERIFGDGSENSSFVKRMKRIEKCNQLAMKRAIHHINARG